MDVYEEVVRLRHDGRHGALATIINVKGSIPSYASAKMLVRDDGSTVGTIGGGCVEAEVLQVARKVMDDEKPQTLAFNLNREPGYDTGLVCGGKLEIYVEPVVPDPVLYIFGAGHVGLNVYKIALLAGFVVVVIDDRVAFANRERFPDATDVIAEDWNTAMNRLTPSPASYILIATRGHSEDAHVLRWAIDTATSYIGMIGSRHKVATVYHDLIASGVAAEKFAHVHAPVGLDIGASTPEEIAVSVVGELIALRRRCAAALPHMRHIAKLAAVAEPSLEKVA
ncbi:MAG: XdhC/CoxI family protein [Azospirillaceae bacterium]|nr:XdhC/CoxI family protein [Azospirillaceae bacterium]